MIACYILGDSIAVGIGQYRPECTVEAEVGINSQTYMQHFGFRLRQADRVIISIGTNDYPGVNSELEIAALRNSIDADSVIWILPNKVLRPQQRKIVLAIAKKNDDNVIDIPKSILTEDGIHPNNYRVLAEMTRNVL